MHRLRRVAQPSLSPSPCLRRAVDWVRGIAVHQDVPVVADLDVFREIVFDPISRPCRRIFEKPGLSSPAMAEARMTGMVTLYKVEP
ncbi:MAG: hypothetical protein ACYDA9_14370 [Terriglobia bacterium]